jgi:cell fate (sporulation/competence/biofilm development) regulator YlbF (YheA/YmcA/DUF963 family)
MIEDKARDLGRTIGQSPEYQALKRANQAIGDDKEAVTLLQQMQQLQQDAQRMLAQNQRPTEEMEQQLDKLLGEIQGKMSYQRLISAQENFDKLMAKVNDWILEGIEKGAASPIITLS